MTCQNIIIDKIDMHIALELSSDLKAIASHQLSPQFKTIITTNMKGDDDTTSSEH